MGLASEICNFENGAFLVWPLVKNLLTPPNIVILYIIGKLFYDDHQSQMSHSLKMNGSSVVWHLLYVFSNVTFSLKFENFEKDESIRFFALLKRRGSLRQVMHANINFM